MGDQELRQLLKDLEEEVGTEGLSEKDKGALIRLLGALVELESPSPKKTASKASKVKPEPVVEEKIVEIEEDEDENPFG